MFPDKTIAYFKNRETPFYYYDLSLLERTLDEVRLAADKYDFHVHYALKANFNDRLLKVIKDAGLGADCVSGNEIKKAVEAGFDARKIVFAGVGKTDKEILTGLKEGIFAFNVESVQELEVINALAASEQKIADIALRINPNVDAQTHKYITTGLGENKFGIVASDLEHCLRLFEASKNINFIGLHFHIGSQITDLKVFQDLCLKINEFQQWFQDQGYPVKVLNVGGGLGVNYHSPDEHLVPDFKSYFGIFNSYLERTANQEVHFELGRSLVAQCGSLISRVLYVKHGQFKNFLVMDAGMTELMRPALYQAYHKVEQLSNRADAAEEEIYDVVGPICESSDVFNEGLRLALTRRNDLLAIRSAGAYGEVMFSHYNLRDAIRHVYSDEIGQESVMLQGADNQG